MNLTKYYLTIGLLLTFFTLPTYAVPVLSTLSWIGISAMVETLMEATLHAFLDPKATQADLQNVQQQVENVENYLAHNTLEDAPSAEEVTQLKAKIAQTSALFAATHGQLENLNQRMMALEQHFTTLHAANASVPTATRDAPLAVKISYLYRSGGRGEFKPFQANASLHSGNHVKIIFYDFEGQTL